MNQANGIVVAIRQEQADEFERLFEAEEVPVWADLEERGLLVDASVTRVAFGTHQTPGVRHYLIYAEFTAMTGHTAHDDHPDFKSFLAKVRAFQPSDPLVFGGRTLFTAGTTRRSSTPS